MSGDIDTLIQKAKDRATKDADPMLLDLADALEGLRDDLAATKAELEECKRYAAEREGDQSGAARAAEDMWRQMGET